MLTVHQAAEKIGVSTALIYGWCSSGQLAHLRLGGKGKRGSIRIQEEDLEEFLVSRRRGEKKAKAPPPRQPALKLKHLQL